MGETTDLFRDRWNNYKDNTRKFDSKEFCMQEHLYKHFQTDGHKGFLNEASVTKIVIKILDANIEKNGILWASYCRYCIVR